MVEFPRAVEAEAPPADHNSAGMNRSLLDAAREIAKLEGEIKGLREQIAEVKRENIKPYMNLSEFRVAYRYWVLEDHEARDNALDNLRIAFEALEIGQQAELFPAG